MGKEVYMTVGPRHPSCMPDPGLILRGPRTVVAAE